MVFIEGDISIKERIIYLIIGIIIGLGIIGLGYLLFIK